MSYPLELNKENLKNGYCSCTDEEIAKYEEETGVFPLCGCIASHNCFTDDCKNVCNYYKINKGENL